jgi:cytochrome c-type biogenesis protein CcmH/NrfG
MNSFIDQIEQVDRDLAEIDAQVATGELDAATAARLRAAYEEERATLLASEAEPPPSDTRRSPQRTLVGGLILGVGAIAIAAFAFVSLQDDSPAAEVSDGVATDVLAGSSGVDLSEATTEEMEAVVADNPTIVGMRLALAGRYVDANDHSTALDHYLTVLDQDPEQPEALAMVGWLSFLAGEAQLAEPFVVKALDIEPDYPLAWWFLANIKVANGDSAAAADAIGRLLAYDLSAEVRAEAERFLAELPS